MMIRLVAVACLLSYAHGWATGRAGLATRANLVKLRMSTKETLSPRDERRRILKSPNYNRMGFKEEKLSVEKAMGAEFASPLVAELRANKGVLTRGDVTIKLAEFYGFCWGVERAVRLPSCTHFYCGDNPSSHILYPFSNSQITGCNGLRSKGTLP
jgi:hypothetical protein